ncbi:nucleolar protein dao-5-like [Patiria miniata]|uniref:Uncharacterized protein n=1 Tax=Patiria miniata TaxID=46514 RepID=A0A914AMU7_PATMI|nr:nucleolar protein dao-5-like [Patiria miniata]
MSELSAKHKALNVLRSLTAEKGHRQVETSPRPDLTSSQEVLAVKYQELATLLATQHVERKTVSRLHSIDLVSRSTGCIPSSRRQRNHDSQVKPVRRRRRKVPALPEPGDTPKIVELPPSHTENEDASELHLNLEQLQPSPPSKNTVSFTDVRLIKDIDDCASSGTDMSDTELIRRILRSPRKVLVNAHSSPSVTARRRTSSSTKKTSKPKKKHCKVKNTPKETPRESKRSDSPKRGLTETPREKKEFQPTDNTLSSSSNPDILSWLKQKNKAIRKQKRSERKKERQEKAAEQTVVEEKLRRLAESGDKFNQWMKHKKEESHRREEIERKVRKDAAKKDASERTDATQRKRDTSPKQAAAGSRTQTKKLPTNIKKGTTNRKAMSSPDKENASDNQKGFDEETRHHLVRNLEAERLHDEAKRQRKEAEKRRRQLLRDAQPEGTKKRDSKSGTDAKPASKTSPSKSQSDTDGKTSSANRKTMPSSNPFKGMTYDDWLRQKQADQRRHAKEAKKQEVCDPELDDLIPLLARRRIEQIKVRATRVDSGLRRSRESTNSENKTDRPGTPNGVRSYTWKTPSSSASDGKQKSTMKPSPPKTKKSDKTETASSTPMPDVVNFERPEPQGCEGNEEFPCQSPKTNQSKDTNHSMNQSGPSTDKLKDSTASGNDQNKTSEQFKKEHKQASEANVIFMTEPTA